MNYYSDNTLEIRLRRFFRRKFANFISAIQTRIFNNKIIFFLDNHKPHLYTQHNKKLNTKMDEIFFLATTNTSNLGDLHSCPAEYFNIRKRQYVYDIVNTFNANLPLLKKDKIIIGGGIHPWLFCDKHFYNLLKGKNHIAWGIGTFKDNIYSNDLIEKFSLIGLRDFNHPQIDAKKIFYVPCSSCLMNEFNLSYETKHEIVFYIHYHNHLISETAKNNIIKNYPCMNNYNNNIFETLKFLASGNVVVTNSYHGAYWATLLNKKVLCVPIDSKFYGFKFSPTYTNFDNWKDEIKNAKSYSEALEDSRQLNLNFYKRVLEVLND